MDSLTLNVREVRSISDESNTLTVYRDAGDAINTGSGWTYTGFDTSNFQVFIQGNATLKIQNIGSTIFTRQDFYNRSTGTDFQFATWNGISLGGFQLTTPTKLQSVVSHQKMTEVDFFFSSFGKNF